MDTDADTPQRERSNRKSIVNFRSGDIIYTEGSDIRNGQIYRGMQLGAIEYPELRTFRKMVQQKTVEMIVMRGGYRTAFLQQLGNAQFACSTSGIKCFPLDCILVGTIEQAG